jgi:hypothetical protein
METVEFILDRFKLDANARPPHFLPISRERGFPELLKDLNFKVGAEIGVERGLYSEKLCQAIPGIKLYSVDSWSPYPGYRIHVSQRKLDGFYEDAHKRLDPYGVTLIREYSTKAADLFEDGSLDFVYIDANHDFPHVTEDINAWSPKVRKGGIVAGHDYLRKREGLYICHVKDVVQAWTYSHAISPWFVIKNDRCPSWFWVAA